jgi:hypothetical protein
MARNSQTSIPPASEPLGRLGRGGGGDRPLRAQLVIASALGLMLLAVPVYLLRRPGENVPAAAHGRAAGARPFGGVVLAEVDAGTREERVATGPLQRVRCGVSATRARTEGGMCDALPPLEAAFRRSVENSLGCAPRNGKEGSINYVLEVDFVTGRLNMFAGKSGKVRGQRGKMAASCVLRSMPEVPWLGLPHEHDYYAVALLATYSPPTALDELPSFD